MWVRGPLHPGLIQIQRLLENVLSDWTFSLLDMLLYVCDGLIKKMYPYASLSHFLSLTLSSPHLCLFPFLFLGGGVHWGWVLYKSFAFYR